MANNNMKHIDDLNIHFIRLKLPPPPPPPNRHPPTQIGPPPGGTDCL